MPPLRCAARLRPSPWPPPSLLGLAAARRFSSRPPPWRAPPPRPWRSACVACGFFRLRLVCLRRRLGACLGLPLGLRLGGDLDPGGGRAGLGRARLLVILPIRSSSSLKRASRSASLLLRPRRGVAQALLGAGGALLRLPQLELGGARSAPGLLQLGGELRSRSASCLVLRLGLAAGRLAALRALLGLALELLGLLARRRSASAASFSAPLAPRLGDLVSWRRARLPLDRFGLAAHPFGRGAFASISASRGRSSPRRPRRPRPRRSASSISFMRERAPLQVGGSPSISARNRCSVSARTVSAVAGRAPRPRRAAPRPARRAAARPRASAACSARPRPSPGPLQLLVRLGLRPHHSAATGCSASRLQARGLVLQGCSALWTRSPAASICAAIWSSRSWAASAAAAAAPRSSRAPARARSSASKRSSAARRGDLDLVARPLLRGAP